MLDRDLRTRLRALAEYDIRLLDAETQGRVLRRIASEGPTIVRRARVERVVTISGGSALAAAAVLALLVGVRMPELSAPRLAAPSLEKSEAPAVVISLPAGRLTVSAAELDAREVIITTPHGEIVTRDGVLAIEASGQTLTVEVAEGSAVVRVPGVAEYVSQGFRLELTPGAPTKQPLDPARAAALRKAIEPR